MAIKIPQREQQTVLQSTRAAQAQVSEPVAPAYSAPYSEAMRTVAHGLQQVGQVFYDLEQKQRALNMASFEADVQLAAKKLDDEMKNSNDYLSFGQKYSDFEKSVAEMGQNRLGQRDYANWAANKGKLLMGGIQLNTAQITAQKKSVALKEELSNNLNSWATLASLANTPEAFEIYSKQAEDALNMAANAEEGATPIITEEEKLALFDNYRRSVGESTLVQDIENNPQMALNNLKNPEMYDFFTPQERQRWIGLAEKSKKTQEDLFAKGWDEIEGRQFAINKITQLGRLDLLKERIEKDEEIDPYKVFSYLNLVDDLTTKESTGYKRKDGRVAFYLEPNEAYQYQKEIIKYFDEVMEKLDTPDKETYFSYGLKAIDMEWDKFVNSHGLNEFDRMDVVREYYRQMASSVPNMQDAAGIGNQAQTMQAAQIAFSNFVAKSTKFNEHEKNIVLTTPKEIKTVYITGEQPLPGRNLPNIKY